MYISITNSIPHHPTINVINTKASIEAQEAGCEAIYHWLTALRALEASPSTPKKGVAQRFAASLPPALRPLVLHKPPPAVVDGGEGAAMTQGEALMETIGCVFVGVGVLICVCVGD